MCVAGKIRFVCKSGQFVTGEFLVDFGDLRWEAIIRTCGAIADKARDLRIGFQRRTDRFDLGLCLLRRDINHNRADLLTEGPEKSLLVVQNRPIRARTVTCAYNLRIEFPGRIQRR